MGLTGATEVLYIAAGTALCMADGTVEVEVRVQFDEQAFILNRRGGIRRYFTELVPALREHSGVDAQLSFQFALPGDSHERLQAISVPGPDRVGRRAAFAANMPFRRRENRGDIIHRTYYHPRFVNRDTSSPVIYSVFDFIPERFPEFFPGGDPHLAKSEALRRASGLLCISEYTRSELLSFYPSLDIPVMVTPLGVSHWWFGRQPKTSDRNHQPTVLFVGRRDGYKDFDVAAQAFAQAGLKHHQLLVAGGGSLSTSEWGKLASLGIANQVVAIYPDDEKLRDMYAQADAFVFPSRMEGFGLPTLEALAAGCPSVLLADTRVSREVAGTEGRFFAAGSSQALAELILEAVALSEEERSCRSAAGRLRAATYSWNRTAALTEDAYQQILQCVR